MSVRKEDLYRLIDKIGEEDTVKAYVALTQFIKPTDPNIEDLRLHFLFKQERGEEITDKDIAAFWTAIDHLEGDEIEVEAIPVDSEDDNKYLSWKEFISTLEDQVGYKVMETENNI